MTLLEELIPTPWGAGYVRASAARDCLLIVRKSVDQFLLDRISLPEAELPYARDEHVDGVELFEIRATDSIAIEDAVTIRAGFPGNGKLDSDEGTFSLDLDFDGGGVSIAVRDERDLGRLGVVGTFADPAEAREFEFRVQSADAGSRIPIAFAWKAAAGFSSEREFNIYSAAERAVFRFNQL